MSVPHVLKLHPLLYKNTHTQTHIHHGVCAIKHCVSDVGNTAVEDVARSLQRLTSGTTTTWENVEGGVTAAHQTPDMQSP